MHERTLARFRCPPTNASDDPIPLIEVDGSLVCETCDVRFPIVNNVARFVRADHSYADNFGVQWNKFRTVQIDRLAGHSLSATRFFADTRWAPAELKGRDVLDGGCGAGRFTDILVESGANVIAFDLSSAVDACRANMDDPRGASESRGTVEVIQADMFNLPLRPEQFDFVHCAGVIQHLPDPAAGMEALMAMVKPGGRIFLNFYEEAAVTNLQFIKYALRKVTPDWPMEKLVRFCTLLCQIFFLPSWLLSKIPVLRQINRLLPICSTHPAGLPFKQQYQMTVLDTVDWYGPKYEIRQNKDHVADLLVENGFEDVMCEPGLAWGRKSDQQETNVA